MDMYCDGSLHYDYGVIGIGVVNNEFEQYIELTDVNLDSQEHEIEALINTIEIGLSKGYRRFKVFNDDKGLVNTTNKHLTGQKVKCKGLLKKQRYLYLLELLNKYNIKLEHPRDLTDKYYIKACHNLSRSYLK